MAMFLKKDSKGFSTVQQQIDAAKHTVAILCTA